RLGRGVDRRSRPAPARAASGHAPAGDASGGRRQPAVGRGGSGRGAQRLPSAARRPQPRAGRRARARPGTRSGGGGGRCDVGCHAGGRGPAGRTMWDKLGNVSETVLASYLKNEYPQTVAVVLSKITPDHAAKVLAVLPEPFAMEVVNRMLRMETVQKEILDDIERTLRSEFMTNLARTNKRDPHESMAEIFNNLDRSSEAKFMTALEERNKESADKIKSLMFTFEDIGKINDQGIQAILRVADKAKLPVALKGANETMRGLFTRNMSERASKLLMEDIASLGPIRVRDVEEAQSHLAQIAKDLQAKGEITVAKDNQQEEMVY
ncbi:MAG: flagellar motor switch protein FliG, partial [Alphaproteobacteria bacterium]|nr:flagellar motor switch protein FliG [Alphaproteobacteria bacterium]